MKIIKVYNKKDTSLNVKVNLARLEQLEATLLKRYVTKVGVLGAYNARSNTDASPGAKPLQSNASIGLVHEFGSYTRNIPERSFLRMPLMLYLKDAVDEASSRINKFIMAGEIVRAYATLGTAAEKVIADAFHTSGFGHWPKLAEETIARKGSDAILIDTGQLRASIHSAVETV